MSLDGSQLFGTSREKIVMTRYTSQFVHYLRNPRAASALEYAILVGVIAVVMAAAVATFTDDIGTALTTIGGKVAGIQMDDMKIEE